LDKQKEGRGGRKALGGGTVYNSTPFVERGNTREEPMDVDDAVVENKGKNRKWVLHLISCLRFGF